MSDPVEFSKFYGGVDPRELPAYTIVDAVHHTRVPLATLRSWLCGRSYQVSQNGKKRSEPIIKRPDMNNPCLSFNNLIEAYVLNAIRKDHKIPFFKVRQAITYLEKHFKTEHPLVEESFLTDGLNLFVEKADVLINVTKHGQLGLREMIAPYLDRIERDFHGLAFRLYPLTRPGNVSGPKTIAIDPYISFGRPVIVGTGIPTAIIAERFGAGESMKELSQDYGCELSQIEEVLRYEKIAA